MEFAGKCNLIRAIRLGDLHSASQSLLVTEIYEALRLAFPKAEGRNFIKIKVRIV
jgi:hypothetical protein